MFEIIRADSGVIGYVDEPRYIKVKPSTGAFIPCPKEDAQGIALKGTPYNLSGHNEITITVMEGDLPVVKPAPEVYVREVDGGEVSFAQSEKIVKVDEEATTGLIAVTDLYEELIEKGVLD